jgi:predicted  nucleic acid-binding Zn-ribbon protein
MSQDKFTEDDEKQVSEIMKKMHKSNDMQEYKKLEKEISKLNKTIQKKRHFIKQFFMFLEI